MCVSVCLYMYMLEMQQYIDISPYRDTLGGDTVSIYTFKLYRYIEYHDISMYRSVSTFRLYTYT